MVLQQRLALYRVAVAVGALLLYLALFPRMGVMRAQCAFGVLGLLGVTPLLFRGHGARIDSDERDRQIHMRALQVGTAAFWLLFAAGLWTLYYHYMNDRVVPVAIISLLAWLTWTTYELCLSAATLVLYARS